MSFKKIVGTNVIRQWNSFLGDNNNKNTLVFFWSITGGNIQCQLTKLGNKCICLNDSMNMPILFCKQEEADARLFLHCKYASAWFREVIIHTTDTDVFVLALGFARSLNCELFIKTGVKGKNNYFDIANRQVKRYLWFPRKWNHDSVNY